MGFNDVGCGFLLSLSGDSHNSGFVPGVTPDFDIIDPERFAHPSQILQSRSQIFLSLSNGSFLLFEFSNPFRALFVTFSKPFRTVRSSVSNYPVRLAFSDRLIPFERTVALSQILVSLSAGSLLLSQILQTLWNGSFHFFQILEFFPAVRSSFSDCLDPFCRFAPLYSNSLAYLWLVGNGRMVVMVVIIVPHSSIPY